MSTSPPNDKSSSQETIGDREFEASLAETQRTLSELKERYHQFCERQLSFESSEGESLNKSLNAVVDKKEELAVYLKFLLFQWSDVKEPFWQAVRFGGVGIIIGWLLKSWAG